MMRAREAPQSRFRRGRALAALVITAVVLLAANLRGSVEPGVVNASPFAEPWEMCDTIGYGWPWRAARWPVNHRSSTTCDAPTGWACVPGPCEDLPVLEPIATSFDFVLALLMMFSLAFLAGGPRVSLRLSNLSRRDTPPSA